MVIAILTALTAFVWALYRLHTSGFDLRVLNPFLWLRRVKWQHQINTTPIHSIENPMEAVALFSSGNSKIRW